MNHKTLKGFTKVPNWIAEACPPMDKKHIAVVYIILRWTQGFHRKKWKFTLTDIAKATGLHRNTISKVLKDLKKWEIIEYQSRKGAITMIEINTQIPKWIDAQSECISEDLNAQSHDNQCTTIGHLMHNESANPPLVKDIEKDINKDNKLIDILLEKWLIKEKLDKTKTYEVFNPLALEQQKKIIKSLPCAMEEFKGRESKWIPEAHNYILNNKYLEFYDMALEKEKADKIANEKFMDLVRMRTPEQQEAIRKENEGI